MNEKPKIELYFKGERNCQRVSRRNTIEIQYMETLLSLSIRKPFIYKVNLNNGRYLY